MATAEAISITNTDEAPKEFTEAFNQIKETANEGTQTDTLEQKRGRGRPRKVVDAADTQPVGQVDEADNITQTPEPVKANVEDEPEEIESAAAEPAAELIPDNWVNAGRKAGMSDNTIQALASENPALLKQLAGEVAQPAQPAPAQAPAAQPPANRPQISDDIFKPIQLKLDPEVHGDEVSRAVDAIVKEVNELKLDHKRLTDQNSSFESERQANQNRAMQEQFDTVCDTLAKELPAVGNRSQKLKPEHLATRETIWKKAFKLSGYDPKTGADPPTQEDWDDAFALYKGKHGIAFIKQQVVSELKQRAGRLTYRPTHKQPAPEPKDGGGEAQFAKEHERIKAKYAS